MDKSSDGTVFDAVANERGFYDVRANGVVFGHAMIPTTADITIEEAVKCWNEEAGLYTYEGENPFPQYIPNMVEKFPHLKQALKATGRKRRNRV